MKPFKEFAFDYMEQLQHALDHVNLDKVKEAVDLIKGCRGTVWLIGNGGSAALASHMATDLQLAEVRAIALTDVAAVTTWANDRDYPSVFTNQLAKLWQDGDILISISGSGGSMNVVQASYYIQSRKGTVIAVTGFDGSSLALNCNLHLNVPAKHMGVSQDGHQVILHIICYFLMSLKSEA